MFSMLIKVEYHSSHASFNLNLFGAWSKNSVLGRSLAEHVSVLSCNHANLA